MKAPRRARAGSRRGLVHKRRARAGSLSAALVVGERGAAACWRRRQRAASGGDDTVKVGSSSAVERRQLKADLGQHDATPPLDEDRLPGFIMV